MLLVSYHFPPLLSAEALLVARTVRELSRLGWQITVLTTDERSSSTGTDEELQTIIPASVEVVRTRSPERLLFHTRGLRRLPSRLVSHVGVLEKELLWYPAAVRRGKHLLRQGHYDLLYSRASPHTSNLVGLALRRSVPLPWVAHLSDPWLDNAYFRVTPLHYKLFGGLEAAIIREADGVVFTTPQTVDLVMGKYPPTWRARTHVISHGYDSEALSGLHLAQRTDRRLRLVYTGSFYGLRTPEPLLHACASLQHTEPLAAQLDVRLVGSGAPRFQSLVERLGLAAVVTLEGPCSFTDSLRVMAAADVLLVIDAPLARRGVFLPSKLTDYLLFQKPILGLTPPNGAAAALLRQIDCPVVAPDDVPAIVAALADLLRQWQQNRLQISPAYQQQAPTYDIRHITARLDTLLRRTGWPNSRNPPLF